MRAASKRILSAQQAVLAERAEREAKEARLFKNRLSRAKSGLRRMLAFVGSQPIRKLVKMNDFLKGNPDLLFYESGWNVIGLNVTSRIRFAVVGHGVRVTMVNSCHVTDHVDALFPCKGKEVVVTEEFGGRGIGEWMASPEEVLGRMTNGTMTSCYKTSEESEAAFRLLASWSRLAVFEKVTIAFLEKLEQQAAWESRKSA
ncbi:MAG: hypothetical protein WC790_03700 [Candidatus Paceibacterota bacterium]